MSVMATPAVLEARISTLEMQLQSKDATIADLRAAMEALGHECERNRYFREIEGKHPQVCGEVYREWIYAARATDANPIAAAAVVAAKTKRI